VPSVPSRNPTFPAALSELRCLIGTHGAVGSAKIALSKLQGRVSQIFLLSLPSMATPSDQSPPVRPSSSQLGSVCGIRGRGRQRLAMTTAVCCKVAVLYKPLFEVDKIRCQFQPLRCNYSPAVGWFGCLGTSQWPMRVLCWACICAQTHRFAGMQRVCQTS
jgi:hypothetical protein